MQSYTLPADLGRRGQGQAEGVGRPGQGRAGSGRGDASLWTGTDEASWLGWLGIVEQQLDDLSPLLQICQDEVKKDGFTHVLLLGMGGSSLCPEVLEGDLRQDRRASPSCTCSTRPIRRRSRRSRTRSTSTKTLFIVSSKSGSHARAEHLQGVLLRAGEAGASARTRRAAASSPSPTPARTWRRRRRGDGFRHIFSGVPSRSAAATRRSRTSAWCRRRSWASTWSSSSTRPSAWSTPARRACPRRRTPALVLGTILGVAANQRTRQGDDRRLARHLRHLGAWLEQLLAESTGKEGKGIIPVDRERLGAADVVRRRSRCSSTSVSRTAPMPRRTPPWTRWRRRASRWCASAWPTSTTSGRGVLPLGGRHRGRGRDPGDQPLRPAGRRGQQARHARAHLRVREDGQAAGGDAVLRRRRGQALRGREEHEGPARARSRRRRWART